MQFVIGVYAAPGSSGAQTAVQFAKTLLKKNHRISQIFFYEQGILHADMPSDFENLEVSLAVCSASKPHPDQKNIKPLSLTQYAHAILEADRHVIFG
jgi:sulfur relay (sulfurtransferase) complex TusBCD TusD component (DsrE family)